MEEGRYLPKDDKQGTPSHTHTCHHTVEVKTPHKDVEGKNLSKGRGGVYISIHDDIRQYRAYPAPGTLPTVSQVPQ